MPTKPTPEQVRDQIVNIVELIDGLTELIVLSGGVPNGHLYARLMDKLDIDTYSTLLGIMKQAGLITERNYFLSPTPLAIARYAQTDDATGPGAN